ncbi:leucine-rich repeat-containing protein 61-like isoform X1 [Lytechinus variegatus]|uniref:leucine-rich repeat-containing protein 61-like isoform X1 n=1 Tax=Lytechinus variegatus TaxID=7654 RepID=UPI001BB1F0E8|nr:leucine-rich repeat-containing protein 61-like isoform X1 [Lytechinus variegatus]
MADESGDKNGENNKTDSSLHGTRITPQLLKAQSGEFEVDSIFSLNLRQQDIDDLGAIGSCSCLQRLDISRNDLTSLKTLTPLKQLVYLNVAANRISSLEPLKEMENLRSLNAAGNLISSLESVYALSNLPNLEDMRFQDTLQDWSNPICNSTTYRSAMMSHFCHLKALDGERLCGKGSEVFTALRQLDRELAKCDEHSGDHVTKKSSGSWVEKGFWDTCPEQKKEIDDTEKLIKEMLLDCRTLSNVALHKIQQT